MDLEILRQFGGGALVLALFIIWKLVEEIIRFRGIKQYRSILNNNPDLRCGWASEEKEMLKELWKNDMNKTNVLNELLKEIKRQSEEARIANDKMIEEFKRNNDRTQVLFDKVLNGVRHK